MTERDIHSLARCNDVETLSHRLEMGADVNAVDETGATALHSAIAWNGGDAVAVLLDYGADVLRQDRDGNTPLHYAVEYKMLDVAEALLRQNQAVIGIANRHGNQPLWTAAFNARGDYRMVELLLRYGGEPTHRNRVDLSPIDIPKRINDMALLQLLESGNLGQT
jgi:ankyrin repeat protein